MRKMFVFFSGFDCKHAMSTNVTRLKKFTIYKLREKYKYTKPKINWKSKHKVNGLAIINRHKN